MCFCFVGLVVKHTYVSKIIPVAMAKAMHRRQVNGLPLPANQAEAGDMFAADEQAMRSLQGGKRRGRRRKA